MASTGKRSQACRAPSPPLRSTAVARMRARRAQWLSELGEPAAAEHELLLSLEEDPAYARTQLELERLRAGR